MSTKIYEAWKVAKPIEDILPQLCRFRKRANLHVKSKVGSIIQFDKDHGYIEWRAEAKKEIESGQRGLFTFQISLMLFPYRGSTLLIGFGLSDARLKLRLQGFEDYAYWNNSDPPKGMESGAGYKAFRERGKVWDKILDKGNGVPTHCEGVVFEVVTPDDIYRMIWDLNREHHQREANLERQITEASNILSK